MNREWDAFTMLRDDYCGQQIEFPDCVFQYELSHLLLFIVCFFFGLRNANRRTKHYYTFVAKFQKKNKRKQKKGAICVCCGSN